MSLRRRFGYTFPILFFRLDWTPVDPIIVICFAAHHKSLKFFIQILTTVKRKNRLIPTSYFLIIIKIL